MRLAVVAVGRLKRGPERELEARYAERCRALGRGLGLAGPDLIEIPEAKPRDAAARRAAEAVAIREVLGDQPFVALDETGSAEDSAAFAAGLRRRADAGLRRLAFVIGGADGLDPGLRNSAADVLSFGRMTLPHQIVRILLAEQLYRAMTILSGHPYHRE